MNLAQPVKAGILSLAVGLALSPQPAAACGGLFCSASAPVNQAAERIIFAQDEDDNVTQIVEIMYSGEAEKFAWVLPVPGTPTPGVSSAQVLDRVQAATNPVYQLNTVGKNCGGLFGSAGSDDSDGAPSAHWTGPEVQVLDSGKVGPFDYDTISVNANDSDPAEAASRWLEANNYDLGPRGAEVLRPYLENGLNLIAFRLSKGNSTGAIRPISLEYKAREMSIPILPTAVAALEDMPILVWLLGEARAVPVNYKSLELNELLINWFNPTSSYNLVVNAAADEAGGQGFVTEFAGATEPSINLRATLPLDLAEIATGGGNITAKLEALARIYGSFDGFQQVATEVLGVQEEDMSEFVNCVSCYFQVSEIEIEIGLGIGGAPAGRRTLEEEDLTAFIQALEQDVVTPLIEATELFESHSNMTRLYTTMSANEMNLDPVFRFNADLGDVSNLHTAEQYIYCDGDFRITLPDGRKVFGENGAWPFAIGDSDMPANARVLQFSTEGQGELLTDNRDAIDDTYKDSKVHRRGGCSFGLTPAQGSAPWGLLFLLSLTACAVLRRRRA